MDKKKVFVSLDWENDERCMFLLKAWNENPQFEFVFDDSSTEEIHGWNISRIKAALSVKINQATHTLVIVGRGATKQHPNHELIGFRNWIDFEVSRSKTSSNKIAAIKIRKNYESPTELIGAGASWAMSFTEEAIIKALNDA